MTYHGITIKGNVVTSAKRLKFVHKGLSLYVHPYGTSKFEAIIVTNVISDYAFEFKTYIIEDRLKFKLEGKFLLGKSGYSDVRLLEKPLVTDSIVERLKPLVEEMQITWLKIHQLMDEQLKNKK